MQLALPGRIAMVAGLLLRSRSPGLSMDSRSGNIAAHKLVNKEVATDLKHQSTGVVVPFVTC